MENWRAVPGYEGLYEVSDRGNVRSVLRAIPHSRHPKGFCVYQPKMLRLFLSCGYPSVKLAHRGNTRTHYVHHLVLAAFVGDRPGTESRGEIRHLDGVKTNCHLDNLAYGTIHENSDDRLFHRLFGVGVSR